jgi:hypothetical protein
MYDRNVPKFAPIFKSSNFKEEVTWKWKETISINVFNGGSASVSYEYFLKKIFYAIFKKRKKTQGEQNYEH